jgi:heme-degrading monooxygenase HmoA
VRDADGVSITVSYSWESLDAIRNWKRNEEHLVAQKKGKSTTPSIPAAHLRSAADYLFEQPAGPAF